MSDSTTRLQLKIGFAADRQGSCLSEVDDGFETLDEIDTGN